MNRTAAARALLASGEAQTIGDLAAALHVRRTVAKGLYYRAVRVAPPRLPRAKTITLVDRVRALLISGEARTPREVAERLGLEGERAKNAFYAAGGRAPRKGEPKPPPASRVRLRVVPTEAPKGPGFEVCASAGGLRRDDCTLYLECLDHAARAVPRAGGNNTAHGRCPAACAWYTPADRSLEFAHLCASRPGGGASLPEGGL